MTMVYVLKEYADPDCNSSTTLGVYEDYADAIKERDRLRALKGGDKWVFPLNLKWEAFRPRDLIDVVKYEVIPKGAVM